MLKKDRTAHGAFMSERRYLSQPNKISYCLSKFNVSAGELGKARLPNFISQLVKHK